VVAVYPQCVSSPVEDGADPNDPETRWFAGGDCASCQHRSYPCSLRQGRRNVLGAVPTPPTAPVESESDEEMEDAPSGQSSQTTVVGRPILESGSRSQHFRTPRIDYNNPTVAAQYVQDLRRHIADVEAGSFPVGSPSTASTASELSWAGLSPPGPQTPLGSRGGWGPRGRGGGGGSNRGQR
jgi:hypothetical protein